MGMDGQAAEPVEEVVPRHEGIKKVREAGQNSDVMMREAEPQFIDDQDKPH